MKVNTVASWKVAVAVFSFSVISSSCYPQKGRADQQIDSLLRAVEYLMYQNNARADSILDYCEKVVGEQIEENSLLWMRLLHLRIATSLSRVDVSTMQKNITNCLAYQNQLRTELGIKWDSINNETVFFQALYYREIGSYVQALENLNRAEQFVKQKPINKANCLQLYKITQFQASIFKRNGEPESAINQFKAGIGYYDCYRDKQNCPNYILLYTNIAIAYRDMGDNAMADHFFNLAQRNVDQCMPVVDYRIANHALILFQAFAEYYVNVNKLDSAKFYFQKSVPLLKTNPIYELRTSFGLGQIAFREGRFDQSLTLYKKALSNLQVFNNKDPWLSRTLTGISSVYQQKGDYRGALNYVQRALNNQQVETVPENDFMINPTLRSVISKRDMVLTLHYKAELLNEFSQREHSQPYLLKARETNLLAIQLLDSTRHDFSLDKDKVILGEETLPIYETSLAIAYELYQKTSDAKYQQEFFSMMDKAKNAVLFDHLKLVRNFSGMPPELIEKERQLKVQLSLAEEKLFKVENENGETSALREEITGIKKAYTDLNKEIKSNHPRYYQLKVSNKIASIEETRRNWLKPREAIVEYFTGDSLLYITCITQQTTLTEALPVDSLEHHVTELRNRITDSKSLGTQDYKSALGKNLRWLYSKIAAPWITKLDTSITSLIIIPHGILSYLPFEILPGRNNEYLIDDFAISYGPSVSLLSENQHVQPASSFFAAFNADYSNSILPQLRGSGSEIKSIAEILGGGSELFENATADDFRRNAADYRIVHLALHSFVNNEKPMFSRLTFSNASAEGANDITANELYAMELHAEMAVLSACETGVGMLRNGEGPMSISRAFVYAGVPCTVISLWKVPDQATSLLLVKFYEYLKAGIPKHDALRLAKKDFRMEYPEMSHPLFWAGFIINGTTDPIVFPEPWWQLKRTSVALLLLIAVGLIVVGIKWKTRIPKRSHL